jgi:hypothetical protein
VPPFDGMGASSMVSCRIGANVVEAKPAERERSRRPNDGSSARAMGGGSSIGVEVIMAACAYAVAITTHLAVRDTAPIDRAKTTTLKTSRTSFRTPLRR